MIARNDIPSLWKKLIGLLRHKVDERGRLIGVVRNAHKKSVIDLDSLSMIEGVFQVSEMQVRDIMVPRSHMIVVEEETSVKDMLPIITASGHSRFPVIGENRDDIVGILLAKDLSNYTTEESRSKFELKDIMRDAVHVPESKRLNVLLKDFRTGRNHMAMVVDEYGGVAGLVTIEDVLEQIVGEIDDEHDSEEADNITRMGLNRYTVRGQTGIDEFNEYFDSGYSDDEHDTVAGLVLKELGHMPERGEEISSGRYSFKVLNSNSRRIINLQVKKIPQVDLSDHAA